MARRIAFTINERGCFICTSHSLKRGYPQRSRRFENFQLCESLHRVIYEECFGAIPEGLEVCHECDEPACINPEHLTAKTHAENMRDTMLRARRTTKVTPELVRELRSLPVGEARRRGVAAGLNVCHVYNIRVGLSWGHIEGALPVKRPGSRTGAKWKAAGTAALLLALLTALPAWVGHGRWLG